MHWILSKVVHQKRLAFYAVLMDTWRAAKELMLFIESLQKIYYCPLKSNHQVDDSGGAACAPTAAWMRCSGMPKNSPTASELESKAFPIITRCACSKLRCVPTTCIGS
jgi:hypothetical protein